MKELNQIPIRQVSRSFYRTNTGLVIDLDTQTPTAIGPLEASYELQGRFNVLPVVKSGLTINDCLSNEWTEFKQVARDELGMRTYNAPLGMFHLARVDTDRVVGIGDGNYAQLQVLSEDFWQSRAGINVNKQLERINYESDMNDAVYEVLARYWNGTELGMAAHRVLRSAMEKGIAFSEELKHKLTEIIFYSKIKEDGSLDIKDHARDYLGEELARKYDYTIEEVTANPLDNDGNVLTDHGKQILGEIAEYWDFLPRELRGYCKTDHIRKRLVEELGPLSKDEYVQSAKIVVSRRHISEGTMNKLASEVGELAKMWERISKEIPEAHMIMDHKYPVDPSLESHLKEIEDLNIWELEGDLRRILEVDRKMMKTHGWDLSVPKELWMKSNRRKPYLRKAQDTIAAIEQQSYSGSAGHRIAMQMYADRGFIVLMDENGNQYPPQTIGKELMIRRAPITQLKVFKGSSFDHLGNPGETCPLGLASKWDTWKFMHDPLITVAAKYHKSENGLTRIEFNSFGKVTFNSENGILSLTLDEAKDLCRRMEDISIDLAVEDKKSYRAVTRKSGGKIEIKLPETMGLASVYFSIRNYLKSIDYY